MVVLLNKIIMTLVLLSILFSQIVNASSLLSDSCVTGYACSLKDLNAPMEPLNKTFPFPKYIEKTYDKTDFFPITLYIKTGNIKDLEILN